MPMQGHPFQPSGIDARIARAGNLSEDALRRMYQSDPLNPKTWLDARRDTAPLREIVPELQQYMSENPDGFYLSRKKENSPTMMDPREVPLLQILMHGERPSDTIMNVPPGETPPPVDPRMGIPPGGIEPEMSMGDRAMQTGGNILEKIKSAGPKGEALLMQLLSKAGM